MLYCQSPLLRPVYCRLLQLLQLSRSRLPPEQGRPTSSGSEGPSAVEMPYSRAPLSLLSPLFSHIWKQSRPSGERPETKH